MINKIYVEVDLKELEKPFTRTHSFILLYIYFFINMCEFGCGHDIFQKEKKHIHVHFFLDRWSAQMDARAYITCAFEWVCLFAKPQAHILPVDIPIYTSHVLASIIIFLT